MTIDTRPSPLAPADLDLRSFPSMLLDVQRLRDSDLAAGDPAHLGLAVIAWAVSWHQLPAGSLPNNDAVLARLMGFGRDLKGWRTVREHALHGYVLCSDDRLYHPVVIEKAIECYERNAARSRKAQKASQARWSKAHGQSTSNAQASPKHHAQAVLVHSVSTPQADAQVVHKHPPSNANRTEQKVTEQNRKNQSPTASAESVAPRAPAKTDVDPKVMDLKVGIVAAYEHANILGTPDTAVVEEWFVSIPHFSPDLALASIKSQLSTMGKPTFKQLSYFEPRIRQKHEERFGGAGGAALGQVAPARPRLVAREDAVCEGDKPLPDVTAHNMIDLWERGGPWAPPLGMRPDQHGCRVPMDILQARGYRDEHGRMSERYLDIRATARANRAVTKNSLEPIPKSNNGAAHP